VSVISRVSTNPVFSTVERWKKGNGGREEVARRRGVPKGDACAFDLPEIKGSRQGLGRLTKRLDETHERNRQSRNHPQEARACPRPSFVAMLRTKTEGRRGRLS